MKLLYKFPSRERPSECQEAAYSIFAHSSVADYHIHFTIDEDDPTAKEYESMFIQAKAKGSSTSKVHAINRDMPIQKSEMADWDMIILMSDDMRFVKEGFDEIIKQDMKKHFPNLDGCLHYNDGHQKNNCMTMTIMGRKYAEFVSKEIYGLNDIVIYHPNYKSLWCDAEATEIAHILGKIIYLGDDQILFRHMHGTVTGNKDELFYRNENREIWNQDKATFLKRRANYYGIPEKYRKNAYKYTNL